MTVGVVVDNVSDANFSIPVLVQYNPAVISVEEVRHGGFLQAGDQEIAIVQKVDNEHGQAIISARVNQTRQERAARHDHGHRDQGARARHRYAVDCAGERQDSAAAADSIGDQRSHIQVEP